MKSFVQVLGLLVAVSSTAVAHSTWQELWVAGTDEAGSCVRLPPSNSPVTSVSSTDIRCNVGGTVGVAGVCDVPAGSLVTAEMHQQPDDRSCANEAIGGNHYGPVIMYMSKVADATQSTGDGSWFKVAEFGYETSNSTWGTQILNDECGKWTFTVPADLAPGDYLLRAEVIALHVAMSVGGAQFYMSCYQLRVTGTGTNNPVGVAFPGAYQATDPGILINIYEPITNYTIPGPTAVAT